MIYLVPITPLNCVMIKMSYEALCIPGTGLTRYPVAARVLLLSRYSTKCSLTELLELQSPMAEIQSETVPILSFLNGAIQRPLSYEQHIMNQKLTCAKKKFEKSCIQSIL